MNVLDGLGTRSRAIATFALGALVAALVLTLVTAVLTSATKSTEIRDQQEQNSPLIENTDQTLKIIEGCTTPGRACYERGQRQLATAVGDINRVVVLAAACASGSQTRTEAEIQACILKRLPRRGR
jgi:hypothetical protein